MKAVPKVAVLVLGYNHEKFLNAVFRSLFLQSYPSFTPYYIDNASQDNSLALVKSSFPTVKCIENTVNLGYAGAYDAALRKLFSQDFDAAVLLNPDIEVEQNWLQELVASAYQQKDIALAQSKLLLFPPSSPPQINTFGNYIHFLGMGFCGEYKKIDTYLEDRDVTYASGASLLIKKEFYPHILTFDTDYFAYLEDQDLGWQARILGFRSVASAKSIAWHSYDFYKKDLSGFKFYLLERNRFYFLLKFFELRTLMLIAPALLIFEGGILFYSLMNGYLIQKLKTYRDILIAIPTLLKKRAQIQKIRTKRDAELLVYLSPTIDFEQVQSPLLFLVNTFFRFYYRLIRYFLSS